jgi:hypothetical protein
MKQVRSRVLLLMALVLVPFLGLVGSASTQDAELDVTIYGPDELVGGASLAEWDARNWQWAVSLPEEANPNFDPTGEWCGYGQHGPVFFLPAQYSEPEADAEPMDYHCVVPEGVALFVPVGGVGCTTVEPPPFFGRYEEELAACATEMANTITDMEVTINGQPVPDVEQYRHVTPLFNILFPVNNFYGVEPGVAQSVTDGYAFIIAPPPPGDYEIKASIMFEADDAVYDTTINLTVTAPQVIEPEASPVASPVA